MLQVRLIRAAPHAAAATPTAAHAAAVAAPAATPPAAAAAAGQRVEGAPHAAAHAHAAAAHAAAHTGHATAGVAHAGRPLLLPLPAVRRRGRARLDALAQLVARLALLVLAGAHVREQHALHLRR